MTGIWRRRACLLVLVAAMALVAAGCMAEVTFTGTKAITGNESDGPFVVLIECEDALPQTEEELEFSGEGTEESSTFLFAPEEPGTATCTITETEQAGASNVTYECGEVVVEPVIDVDGAGDAGGGPGMSVSRGINGITAECFEEEDGLRVEIVFPEGEAEAEISVSFTVTNDFPPDLPTTTTTPPAAAEPVAAQPTFTG